MLYSVDEQQTENVVVNRKEGSRGGILVSNLVSMQSFKTIVLMYVDTTIIFYIHVQYGIS